MVVTFSEPIQKLEGMDQRNKERTVFALTDADWHKHLNAGQSFDFNFKVTTKRKGGFKPQFGRPADEAGLHCVGRS